MIQRPTPETFEALVHAHSAATFRAARRITGDDAPAFDVVQEVFLAVLEGRLDLSQARDVGALLRTRAVHTALSQHRGAARRRVREEQHAMQQPQPLDASVPAEHADEARSLWAQLVRLPEELRLALLLRYREGYSFANIGRELGCAEPTAHDRVRRGLERLRALLTGAGLAALAVDLEERVGRIDSPAPLPAELAARLLERTRAGDATLAAATTSGGATLSPLVAVGLVLTASVAAFVTPRLFASPSNAGPSNAGAAPLRPDDGRSLAAAEPGSQDPAIRGERVSPAPVSQDPSAEPPHDPVAPGQGQVTGRVVDRAGGGVPGATVHLSTVERRGKFELWGGDGKSDINGYFTIDVPVPEATGRSVEIDVGRLGFMARVEGAREVHAGRETRLGDVMLDLLDLAREGEFTLDLEVRGGDGLPLAGAFVGLHHQVPGQDVRIDQGVVSLLNWSWERGWHRLKDDTGRTGAGGLLALHGKRLGGKVLIVKPSDPAWAPIEIELPIETAGTHTRVVTLAPGRVIEGRVTDLAGRPLAGVNLNLIADAHPNRDWFSVRAEPSGSFRFAGLAEGGYELRVQAPGRSAAHERVDAGERDVAVMLKLDTDARDVGDHAAEIHGRLVDGEGKPVLFEPPWDVEAFWFPAVPGADVQRDVLPNHLLMPPVQRAAQMGAPEDPPPTAEFHLTGLRAGPKIIYVQRTGYAPAFGGPFVLEHETLVADVEIRMHARHTLRARVRERDGDALEGALIFLTGEGPYSDERVAEADAAYREAGGRGSIYDPTGRRTNASGWAQHEYLPVGLRVVLVALHPDFEPVRSLPFVLGDVAEHELRFCKSR